MIRKKTYSQIASLAAIVLLLAVPTFNGCSNSSANNDSGDASSRNGLAKLDFHRPEDLDSAHKRLVEIHDVLNSDKDIPEPRKIKVVEVIHGEGASAHSHYYRVTKSEAGIESASDHVGHNHEGEKSEQKQHEIEIDIFTEVYDIARWLPSIAADTDTDEATWKEIKKNASELESLLEKALTRKKTDSEKRSAYQGKSKEIADLLKSLKPLCQSDENEKGS